MTKLTVTFAMTLTLLIAQHALAQPVVKYDAAIGNITFEGFVGVNLVRLWSSDGNLIPDSFPFTGYLPTEKTTTLFSLLDFGAGITGDDLDAGNIVRPFTSLADLMFEYKIGLAGPLTAGEIILETTTGNPFAVPNIASESHIPLQQVYDDRSGLFSSALTLANEGGGTLEILDVTISNDSESLFGAVIDGLDIDLTIDVETATQELRNGAFVSADLLVETNGGDLNYSLSARVGKFTRPILFYNPTTGNVTLNGFKNVNSARLYSAGGNLIPDVGEDIGFLTQFSEKTATLYSWVDFGAGVTGDGLVAGNIITPGTDVSDLLFDYKMGLAGPIDVGEIRVVPEPTTFVLAGIGLVGFWVRHGQWA